MRQQFVIRVKEKETELKEAEKEVSLPSPLLKYVLNANVSTLLKCMSIPIFRLISLIFSKLIRLCLTSTQLKLISSFSWNIL